MDLVEKLSTATAGDFQFSTDGFTGYPNAVEYNLGARVDYAQVVKEFANEGGEEGRRYAPPRLKDRRRSLSPGTRMRIGSAPTISSGATGRSEATCAGSPGCRTASAGRSRIFAQRCALLRLLQLCQDAQVNPDDARQSWDCPGAVVSGGATGGGSQLRVFGGGCEEVPLFPPHLRLISATIGVVRRTPPPFLWHLRLDHVRAGGLNYG